MKYGIYQFAIQKKIAWCVICNISWDEFVTRLREFYESTGRQDDQVRSKWPFIYWWRERYEDKIFSKTLALRRYERKNTANLSQEHNAKAVLSPTVVTTTH